MSKIAGIVCVMVLTASSLQAAGRTEWAGKDGDGDRYVCNDTGGGRWQTRFIISGELTAIPYKEVARNDDYIELQDAGARIRLYDDRMECLSRGRWVKLCNGRWRK